MRIYSILLVTLACQDVLGKVFQRCELVQELSKKKHRIPPQDLGTWVCIARHESHYNTSAVGHLNADKSGDHGLLQISDQYWCSPPGVGMACGLHCDQLEDDDITDDVICARRIYRAHKRRSGDGFTAWAVYGPHCRGDNSAYTEGCEDWEPTTPAPLDTSTSTETYTETTSEESVVSSTEEYKILHQKLITTDQNTDLPAEKLVAKSRSNQFHARLSETSSPWSQDPKTAWLAVHYHPRFLDETL